MPVLKRFQPFEPDRSKKQQLSIRQSLDYNLASQSNHLKQTRTVKKEKSNSNQFDFKQLASLKKQLKSRLKITFKKIKIFILQKLKIQF